MTKSTSFEVLFVLQSEFLLQRLLSRKGAFLFVKRQNVTSIMVKNIDIVAGTAFSAYAHK